MSTDSLSLDTVVHTSTQHCPCLNRFDRSMVYNDMIAIDVTNQLIMYTMQYDPTSLLHIIAPQCQRISRYNDLTDWIWYRWQFDCHQSTDAPTNSYYTVSITYWSQCNTNRFQWYDDNGRSISITHWLAWSGLLQAPSLSRHCFRCGTTSTTTQLFYTCLKPHVHSSDVRTTPLKPIAKLFRPKNVTDIWTHHKLFRPKNVTALRFLRAQQSSTPHVSVLNVPLHRCYPFVGIVLWPLTAFKRACFGYRQRKIPWEKGLRHPQPIQPYTGNKLCSL